MSAVGKKTGAWDGTSGSPQGKLDNGDYERNSNHDLTPAQIKAVKKAEDNINDHLNDEHLEAAEGDLKGRPIPKKTGGSYEHIKEVENAIAGIESSKNSIQGSLKNPNLSQTAKKTLNQELNRINERLEKWNRILKGIKK